MTFISRNSRSYFSIVAAILLLGISNLSHAKDEESDAEPEISLAKLFKKAQIEVKGYIDMGYMAHSQMPDPSVQVFDTSKNSFVLNQGSITISRLPAEGMGGLVNLTAGSNAGIICSYGACSGNNLNSTNNTPGSGGYLDVTQAFMQYAKNTWTLMGGKYTTLAGVEYIDSGADTNITRSILFGKIPFTHTGLRAIDIITDATTLTLGVNNGWDQVTGMTASKTLEFALNEAFTKDTSLLLDAYTGNEMVPVATGALPYVSNGMYTANTFTAYGGANARAGNRTLFDMVFTSNLTQSLTFILNADHATQQNEIIGLNQVGTETYWGFAGYLNYQINDQYRVSLRGEQVHDSTGAAFADGTGGPLGAGTYGVLVGPNTVREATLTLGYAPVKAFELRAELREDRADKGLFAESNGLMSQTMTTYGLQGIYKF
ncbi:MAG: outer membrane beta-barrel protein [Ferrovum sp.]|nr:outer membrane beta-barrel protein [Ferrovum sp.]NDU88119.1 outer membrane beta-barrel protein [Ferrovum sp.]